MPNTVVCASKLLPFYDWLSAIEALSKYCNSFLFPYFLCGNQLIFV